MSEEWMTNMWMMNECACKHEKFVQTDIQGYVSVIGRRSLFILYLFVDFLGKIL